METVFNIPLKGKLTPATTQIAYAAMMRHLANWVNCHNRQRLVRARARSKMPSTMKDRVLSEVALRSLKTIGELEFQAAKVILDAIAESQLRR